MTKQHDDIVQTLEEILVHLRLERDVAVSRVPSRDEFRIEGTVDRIGEVFLALRSNPAISEDVLRYNFKEAHLVISSPHGLRDLAVGLAAVRDDLAELTPTLPLPLNPLHDKEVAQDIRNDLEVIAVRYGIKTAPPSAYAIDVGGKKEFLPQPGNPDFVRVGGEAAGIFLHGPEPKITALARLLNYRNIATHVTGEFLDHGEEKALLSVDLRGQDLDTLRARMQAVKESLMVLLRAKKVDPNAATSLGMPVVDPERKK